jgi:G:T-mismatch repair DNA endonuclease (very short patch repair protein)
VICDMDIVSPETRSRMMSMVGQRGTRAELAVRRMVANLGVRYRLNANELPEGRVKPASWKLKASG